MHRKNETTIKEVGGNDDDFVRNTLYGFRPKSKSDNQRDEC